MIKINPGFIAELEKKNIKKEFNINDIEKKFDFIKKNYTSEIISVNLTELYFILISPYSIGYYRSVLNFIFLISSYIKLAFVNKLAKKKKYSFSNFIIFSKNKYVDQFNFSETSNFLLKKNKKHLIVLNHTKDNFERISRLYQSKNVVNLRNFLNFSSIIKSIIRFSFHLSTINKIISLLNCKKRRFQIYHLFFIFFINSEMWSNLIKDNKIKKIFLTNFLNDTALIYLNKVKNKKIEFIGYAIHGLNGDAPRYIFHNLDKLLVWGKGDAKIIKDIEKFKLRFMSLPKKTLIVGSIRHDYFSKRISIKKKKKNPFTILYIKSNPAMFNGLEDKAFLLFSKIMKNFKNIKYTIKDRENLFTENVQKLIERKIIKKKYIEKSGPIENYIHKADLCVGIVSTALLKQAICFNKPIIQLYAKQNYMWDTSRILPSVNSKKKMIFLIKKLSNDKKYYDKYNNLNKKIKSFILSNELKSNKQIYDILK
jgi:hypothetical protein